MSTTITLTLSNFEVQRLFLREIRKGVNFYQEVMHKVGILMKRSQAHQAYALLHLYNMHETINVTVQNFYDEVDKYEGVLEKKKHLAGKKFSFKPQYFPEVAFDNAIASILVELFEVYDRLISQLKILRTAGCFSNHNDYYNNLRRSFKSVNTLLSQFLLISVKELPPITVEEAIDKAEPYQLHVKEHGEIDYLLLYKALTSNIALRLEEKNKQPLLALLNKRLLDESATNHEPLSNKEVIL